MADAACPPRRSVSGIARNAAISAAIGVAFVFLVCASRPQLWSWRLALWGAAGGLTIYAFCHFLDFAVGDRIRRWKIVPDPVVGVPLYFLGGTAGFLATTALLEAIGLMPFTLTPGDLRFSLAISGGVSIFIGVLFYSFHMLGRRLEASVARIKEQEFAEKELELARSIQSRLLPPGELSGEGYRVAARNLAARFVAGDFYDVFRLPDGSLGLAVADVSGKGMGASLIMASVKAVLPLIAEGRGAAATLTELNRRLSRELAPREFVAMGYARFDPVRRDLEIANAGLPDPYVLRGGAAPEALSVPGPRLPLGARPSVEYQALAARLDSGSRLLLFTDGLPEAPTAAGDPLGYEALAGLLSRLDGGPPGAMLDRLFEDVRAATRPGLDDDWTALLLESVGKSPDR
ncbi:MAG TPA: PP2C family protein-serine/threonine phosphatase [Thermoanaerobaculia bacterium]|nr:PP2C family protein-serine/threonine phosphatase [Thermoanaerobaculia bacterium]